jgi:hypothetical protein
MRRAVLGIDLPHPDPRRERRMMKIAGNSLV